MTSCFLPICLLLAATSSLAQSYTVDTVPNVRLVNNSHVSNPDGLLSSSAVTQIDASLAELENTSTAQVAVVMLKSIGETDVTDFAQSLFVKWGIGKSGADNGLLILFVQDKRTVRFHTGYGLEPVLPDAVCKRIQTRAMVPRFRKGDVDGGMIAGIAEVKGVLTSPREAERRGPSADGPEVTDLGAISFLAAIAWLFGCPWRIDT